MALPKYRLNFARAFRPKQFCDVVGQQTPLRLLEHSLAKQIYFPVYLFSGMRGSGKTSVGRLFAAAVNCEQFSSFVAGEVSWGEIPCGKCHSCLLMSRGEHPDFIEVDAASYTGVENIRQIMDEAQFLPIVGRRKVYLVDEAHMLSKSAFNAFLKMLEEPPASVVFLLATTEAHKIIDTVRSRSFQLFFDPLPFDILADYLVKIAKQEGFLCDSEAASLLAQQSEGSVRDALTALEQAWVAGSNVTASLVKELFGLASYVHVFDLFEHIVVRDVSALAADLVDLINKNRSLSSLWVRCVEVVTGILWFERGVIQANIEPYQARVSFLIETAPKNFFTRVLDLLFKYEPLLQKTHKPFHLFERFILSCLEMVPGDIISVAPGSGRSTKTLDNKIVLTEKKTGKSSPKDSLENQTSSPVSSRVIAPIASEALRQDSSNHADASSQWSSFIALVRPLCVDPILGSVLLSGTFVSADASSVRVSFPKSFAFYQELLVSSQKIWQEHLEHVFGVGVLLVPSFSLDKEDSKSSTDTIKESSRDSKYVEKISGVDQRSRSVIQKSAQSNSEILDVSDVQEWPVVSAITKVFPGTVKLYEE